MTLIEDRQAVSNEVLLVKLSSGFQLQRSNGEPVPLANRKARGLLAYLALGQNLTESRERIAGLLWSDSPEDQARASLRQSLKQMRNLFEEIGFEGFTTDRSEIGIDRGCLKVDLHEIDEALARGELPPELLDPAAQPVRILHGYGDLDPSFAAWLGVLRQGWQDRYVAKLQAMMRASGSDPQTAGSAAEALIRIDLTHEEAHRHLIRQHADDGNTAAALRQYKILWGLLDEDFDMEPDDETQALIAEIKSGTFVPRGSVAGGPVADHPVPDQAIGQKPLFPMLFVKSFMPGSAKLEAGAMVEGFRQDLVASLVRFRDWVVIDGSHSADGNAKPGYSGPQYEIGGTYYDDDGQAQLVVTLKFLPSGQYVWSERMALNHDNWFVAQRQFVTRVSTSLSIYMTAQSVAQQITQHDISKDSYQLWLEAYRLIWSWDPAVRREAEQMFRQLNALYPSFAPAYSGLASIFNTEQMIYPGVTARPERLEEAASLARTAVAIDPLDVRNQVALAWSNGMTGRYDQAEVHHRMVHDLNPNNPTTLISCANGLAMCGRVVEAKQMSEEAIRLLPSISPAQWGYLASTRFVCGDYEGCIEAADHAGDAIPVTPGWKAAATGLVASDKAAKDAGKNFTEFVEQRWLGETPCTAPHIADWFLQHCPVKQPDVREQMKKGLRKAGLQASAS